MLHFYDGQIRRYVTQLVRLMSNFSYKDGKDQLVTIPVMYGDITRQVGNILRDNSENKLPSVPRMGLYITGLEQDRDRTSDSSYVHKVHIRERAWDENNEEYLNTQGKNYTVERLMPSPYTLTVNVDIWTSNTDQKLQIIEQILTLFNPTLEIQTTDNYVDWTSLSVVNLTGTNFSSRSIPTGTESEIDVATLTFTVPIYISPPVKVKRLGVINNIITSIFDESQGTIQLGIASPNFNAWDDGVVIGRVDRYGNETYIEPWTSKPYKVNDVVRYDGTTYICVKDHATRDTFSLTYTYPNEEFPDDSSKMITVDLWEVFEGDRTRNFIFKPSNATTSITTTYQNQGVYVDDDKVSLIQNGRIGEVNWRTVFEALAGEYNPGVSQIHLIRLDLEERYTMSGTFALSSDETKLIVNWNEELFPSDSVIPGPNGDRTNIDYVINPANFNPTNVKTPGVRLLLLDDIGNASNTDGPDAWKGAAGDFVASANDIIEWDGNDWKIVFDADVDLSVYGVVYTTNLNTGIQYRFDGEEWLKSVDGEYPRGSWRIAL